MITKINGKDVNDDNVLRNTIASMPPGTEVTLTVWRDGKEQDVKAKLGTLTPESARATEQGGGGGKVKRPANSGSR